MKDLFGAKYPELDVCESSSRIPTLPHVVDLMKLTKEQLEKINEAERLINSRQRVFEVFGNVVDQLNLLGSWDWDLFSRDTRLGAAFSQYESWLFDQLPPPEYERDILEFELYRIHSWQIAIARLYFEVASDPYVEIKAIGDAVSFRILGVEFELPAFTLAQGSHIVRSSVLLVLLTHLEESGSAKVELTPMRYQINNTTVYPPRPANCFDDYKRYLNEHKELKKYMMKQGHSVENEIPMAPDVWVALGKVGTATTLV